MACVLNPSSVDVANPLLLPPSPYPGTPLDNSLHDIGELLSFPHDIAADTPHHIHCSVAVSKRSGVPHSEEVG